MSGQATTSVGEDGTGLTGRQVWVGTGWWMGTRTASPEKQETDRHTDRQRTETERERRQKDIQRQTDRDRGTEADRDKERERERQTDRQRPTDRDRKRSVPLREARSGSSGPITQPTKDPVDKEGQDTRP